MNVHVDVQKLIPAWQVLCTIAPIAHIRDHAEYEKMTEVLNALLDVVRDDANHPLYPLVAIVGDLIAVYEQRLVLE